VFAENPSVSFGDVNLSEEQIRGNHNPGAGGWPTIKYFNKKTGYEGEAYAKRTDESMCDELGPKHDYMQLYVEEAGETSLCSAVDNAGCSEKEVKYIDQWKVKDAATIASQITRLDGMSGKSMKPSLQKWVQQRLAILKQLRIPTPSKEEL